MVIHALCVAYVLLGLGVAVAVFKSEDTGFRVFVLFMLCVVIWPVLFMSVVTAALIAVATGEPQIATVRTEQASTTKAEGH